MNDRSRRGLALYLLAALIICGTVTAVAIRDAITLMASDFAQGIAAMVSMSLLEIGIIAAIVTLIIFLLKKGGKKNK